VVVPRTNGIVGFSIDGVVMTINWGSGGGPKVATKFHDPLVVDGVDGNVPTIEGGSTGTMGAKTGSKGFMSRGLKGGRNPSVKKSFGKLESPVVQTYPL